MSNPVVITRDTVSRPWAELEPKIAIALITGFLAVIALIVSKSFGVKLPVEVHEVVPLAFALICGYITKSSGTTVTRYDDNGAASIETHSAPTVTTVTASTPIQQTSPGVYTKVIDPVPAPVVNTVPAEDQATAIIPPSPSAFSAARWGATAPATSGTDGH